MKFTSPVYSAASGSIAGLTYSRNRGGQYTRKRSIPSNPRTDLQTTVRTNLITASQAWATLSDAEREAWGATAAAHPKRNSIGQDITLAGQQFFVGENSLRSLAGSPALEAPPVDFIRGAPPALPPIDLDTIAGLVNVTIASDSVAADILLAFISRPCSPGRNPMNEPFRFLGSAPLLEGSANVSELDPYGMIVANQVRAIRLVWVCLTKLCSPSVYFVGPVPIGG